MRSRNGLTLAQVLGDRAGISEMEYAILTAAVLGALITAVTAFGADVAPLLTACVDYIGGIRVPAI